MKALAMNSRTRRLLLATVALAAFALPVKAQVANISTTTAVSGTAGVNLTTGGMVSAISNTYFMNDGDTGLLIKGGASAVTATVVTQATTMSQAGYGSTSLSNLVLSVPANAYIYAGPFPTGRWNTQFGTVAVSFTSVTGVSVTAISQAQ